MSLSIDPNAPFTPETVGVLDRLVSAMNSSQVQEREHAIQNLNQLKENGNMWVHVGTIIDNATNPDTKFFALSLLEHVISTAWNAVPEDQRNAIKNYVVKLVIENASSATSPHFLNKLNTVLVQIVKREWTTTWKEFISEICNASKSSQPLCENTMNVLKLLSQEIFDERANMTSTQLNQLKSTMNQEFSKIYEICDWVLKTAASHPGAVQNSLIKATLSTLAAFLEWVPAYHIFSGDLMGFLVNNFLTNELFNTQALECLSEVAKINMKLDPSEAYFSVYQNTVLSLLTNSMSKLSEVMHPKNTNFTAMYNNTTPQNQLYLKNYCQQLALFLQSYISTHIAMVDQFCASCQGSETEHSLLVALDAFFSYSLSLSEFPEDEIFKICCEFWHCVSKYLYEQKAQGWLATRTWTQIYRPSLTKARSILVPKMARPTEVLVSVDEQGNVVREKLQDTEVISLYELMRETLVYLTHLDPQDTESIIKNEMSEQMTGNKFSWQRISSLAYAIGSISGAMEEEHEKRFLIYVVKELLAMCEGKRGKPNKAVVATNIMYVVMQYPRFLKQHWNFLKTVVKKLFEFMRETHPGIQDMSVDTFLKITQNCGPEFLTIYDSQEQREPFIFEIIRSLPKTISDLENHQKLVFYQALGTILSNLRQESEIGYQLSGSLHLVQEQWNSLLQQLNLSTIQDPEFSRGLTFCLRAFDSLAGTMGHFYYIHLGQIFPQMTQLYEHYSQYISAEVGSRGPVCLSHSQLINARAVRKRILGLLSTYTKVCESPALLTESFVPSIVDKVLGEFVNSPAECRECEAISLMADLTNKVGTGMLPYMNAVLGPFLDTVLNMLVQDFHSYPEHRSAFFELIKAVTEHCFDALLQLPIERFKVAVDAVIWASKHHSMPHAEAGLLTLKAILFNLENSGQVANYFYQHFYMYILTEVLAIMTDSAQLPNFKHHAHILRYLFFLVESGAISVPIAEQAQTPENNKNYIVSHLTSLLAQTFTNMNSVQIEALVLSMFNKCNEISGFKTALRDFLVNTKQIANDNEAFYAEEKEKEIEEAKRREQERKSQVPGLVQYNY